MENQTNYERANANGWRIFQDKHYEDCLIGIRKIFDDAFMRGYHWGIRTAVARTHTEMSVPETDHIPEAAKKVDRAMIAAMAMQGLLSNSTIMVEISMAAKRSIETKAASPEPAEVSELAIKTAASAAVRYANALIAELGKEEK